MTDLNKLKAEIEALLSNHQVWDHHKSKMDTVVSRADVLALIATHAAEPAPVAVEVEWHRADNSGSILLYTLKQDGWRKGQAVMVNDLTIRIENANKSANDLEAVADRVMFGLTADLAPTGNTALPDDLFSHREAWRGAIVGMRDASAPATVDADDESYWSHELAVFDRVYVALSQPAAQQPIPEVEAWKYENIHDYADCGVTDDRERAEMLSKGEYSVWPLVRATLARGSVDGKESST